MKKTIGLRGTNPLLGALFVLIGAILPASAASTWSGGANPDFNWSNAGNWDAAPAATGGALIFAGATGLMNTNNSAVTSLGSTSITFASGAGSFVLSGANQVTVGNGGANDNFVTKVSTADQTIAFPIKLAGGQHDRTIIMTGGGSLTLSGNIDLSNDWLFPTTTAGTVVLSGNNTGDGKGGVLTSGANTCRAMMRNNVAGTQLVLGSNTALGNSGSGDVGLGTANFRGLVANQNMTISTTGGARNLSGSTIIINTANVTYNGTDNFTIGNLIVQGGNRDFWVASTGGVTVQNSLSLSSDATGRQLYLNLTGTGGMVVNGAVYDTFLSTGITSGTSTFRKAGAGTMTVNGLINGANTAVQVDAGTLILTSANSYKGTTLIGGGTLVVSSAQLATNTVTVASGAALQVNVSGTSQLQPGTLAASSSTLNFGNLSSLTTAPVLAGAMALNGAVTVNITNSMLTPGSSYPLVTWGSIGGTGGFVLGSCPLAATLSTNGNTLQLDVASTTTYVWSGANNGNWDTSTTGNWTGGTGIYADGNVAQFDDTLTGTTNVTVNSVVSPGIVQFNNNLSNYVVTSTSGSYLGGAGSLTKSGSGTLTLIGPNTYSGGTTLSAGQLNLNDGGSSSANSAIGTGGLTITGGALDNTSAGDVTLAPTIAQHWNGDFAYIGSQHNLNLGNGAVTLGGNRQVAVTNTLTVGGVISDSGAGYSLTKTGNGTLALAGLNSFSGGLTVNTGTVRVGNAGALGSAGVTNAGGAIDLNGYSVGNSLTVTSSSRLTNSSASASALTTDANLLANLTVGTVGNITSARLIGLGVPRTITKVGTGTLTTTGSSHNNLTAWVINDGKVVFANTSGLGADRGVTLNAGTLQLSGANANLINDVEPFTVNGGTFDLNGKNETVAVIGGTNGVILNNASGTTNTLTVGGDSGTNVYSGSIQNGSGVLALALTGTGTQILANTNTYSGGTTISSGVLQAGSANVLPTAGGNVTVTGTLDLNGFNNMINGLNGSGVVDIITNPVPATLTVGYNGNSGSFSGTLQNTAGTLSLTKVGAGTQVLSGANIYGGSTTVSNGTLVIGSSLSGAGAVTVQAPGVLNASNYVSIAGAVALSGTNATLSLLDGQINALSLSSGLTLTSSNVLKFDISGYSMDSISVGGAFAQTGKVVINVNAVTTPGANTYTLISGATGISSGNFVLGNTLPGYTLALSSDASDLYLTVTVTAPAQAYWNNHVSTVWSDHSGGTYNWDTDQSSAINTGALPGSPSDVFFAANGASSFATTLGADFIINSLTFNTANSVTIAGAANSLTLNGPLTVNSGAGNDTISASNLVLGVDQNVNVTDAGNTLTISSPITGSHALNINPGYGSGTVALAGSSTFTGNTTITYGTLALKNPTNSLPDTGAVNISGGILSIGTNNDTVGAVVLTSGTITGSSGVLKGSSYDVENSTVSANLGGPAAMTTVGSVLLASNSTYSGGTTISSGTLQLGASNALGSGSVTIGANTLDLNGQTIPNNLVFNLASGILANNSATAASVTADANINNNSIDIDTTGGDITVARLIGNTTRTVLKTGGNTLTLNGAGHNNNIKLQVQGGTVICANNGGYSADRGLELDYGTVKLAGPGSGGSYPNANLINDGQQFWILGTPSTFDLNGWNETVGTVYGVSGAVIENNAAGTNSTLSVGGDNVISVNNFSGTLQNGGGTLSITKIGTGMQIFDGIATYSGNTTISSGQLQVTASGASPNSTFVVNTNGGLLFQSDLAFTLGGLGGSGNVDLVSGGSPISLTVGGNNATTTYSGILSDDSTGSALIKVGSGKLTLSGANTYTGLTTASNGVLVISPSYIAGGNFTINEGAAFGVAGNSPTTSAQIGTLTAGVSGSGNSTLLFTSLPVPTNAPITVNTFTPVGGAGSVIISNTAVLTVGTYNLINYTTLGGVGFSAFTLGALPPGTVAHLNNNTTSTPKVIQLVVTAIAPQIWSGAVNTNWDINTTANWKLNSVATNYFDLSPVLFDDSVGSGYTTVSLVTNVQPTSVTVSNITKNYNFTTSAGKAITGSAGLLKTGSGSLTLLNLTNTYSGGTIISNGTLVLASSTLGSGGITANGSLVFSNSTQLVANIIGGTGTVTQDGGGSIELSGANSYNGGTIIKNGTVQSDNSTSLGAGMVTLGDGASANNATLQANPNSAGLNNTNNITVAAGGSGVYTIQDLGGRDYSIYGTVALNNALTMKAASGGALFMRGAITSGGSNPALTIVGNGTVNKFVGLYVDNSATFTGNFIVTNGGDLKIGVANGLSAASAVALDSTSAFDNGSLDQIIAGLNDFGGSGGTVAAAGVGKFVTLGGSGTYSFSGVINNTGGIIKAGSGQQTLSGTNTYTGSTVVSNGTLVVNGSLANGTVTVAGGTLAGAGVLKGATTVQGGTLSPGVGGIGTLTISNSLTLLAGGNLAVDINQTAATQDQIVGLTTVTYGGTLTVNNLSGALTPTDSFKLFSAGSYNGAFASISPSVPAVGYAWNTNTLTTDGTLRISSGVATNPTNITAVVNGSNLELNWPADHTGWYLQAQTNTLGAGLGTNWVTISNSVSGNSYTNTLDPTKGAVFYRLVSP